MTRRFVTLALLPAACLTACQDGGGPQPDIVMGTPFVANADVASINEAFSATASAPWGFAHDGVDFFPNGDFKPFQSVSSGVVEAVQLWQNNITGNWQVNLRVRFSSEFSVEYIFEPFTTTQADGQVQLDSIAVTTGQVLAEGQVIGTLKVVGAGAHLHFGLRQNDVALCPEPYFTPAARDSILALIHKDHATWNMCY